MFLPWLTARGSPGATGLGGLDAKLRERWGTSADISAEGVLKGWSGDDVESTGFETAMMDVPRLALATAATGPEPSVMALALLAGLTENRWCVQHFRTRACPAPTDVAGHVTGLPGRHLDSWLMPDPVCRSLFLRGMQGAE